MTGQSPSRVPSTDSVRQVGRAKLCRFTIYERASLLSRPLLSQDRERVQAMIEQRQRELEQQLLELEREEQEAQAAALRIQRSYRGHQVRT